MRRTNMNVALGIGAVAAMGLIGSREVLFVDDGIGAAPARRVDRSTKPDRVATAADEERISQAAERRARKVARQAKGFV